MHLRDGGSCLVDVRKYRSALAGNERANTPVVRLAEPIGAVWAGHRDHELKRLRHVRYHAADSAFTAARGASASGSCGQRPGQPNSSVISTWLVINQRG
jgi:hypothetical protein